jgi:flagellum-specific peptidoglycan hydrolase FlgJ
MSDPKIPAAAIAAAQFAHGTTGTPASISLAQWVLESGWGQHMPEGSNNPFGVKAAGAQPYVWATTEEYDRATRQMVTIRAKFRAYPSLGAAFEEHAWLLAGAAYADARRKLPDAIAFARAISPPNRPAYATDPAYADKLVALIEAHNLTRYDGAAASLVTAATVPAPQATAAPYGGTASWLERFFGWG